MQSRTSIRKRLAALFFLVAAGPFVLLGAVLVFMTYRAQVDQSAAMAREVVRQSISEIDWAIHEIEMRMTMLVAEEDFLALDPIRRKEALSTFRGLRDRLHGDVINDVRLLDRDGMELARVSRAAVFVDSDMKNRSQEEFFRQPLATGAFYYDKVRIGEAGDEPVMIVSLPVIDVRQGRPHAVLAVEVRLNQVWDEVVGRVFGKHGSVYVTDSQGRVLAHHNQSVVYRNTVTPSDRKPGVYEGVEKEKALVVRETFYLGQQRFFAVAELPVAEALALPTQTLFICVSFLGLLLIVVAVVGHFQVNQVVRPIEALAGAARAIQSGDYLVRAEEGGSGEVAELARSFNRMTTLLTSKIDRLEKTEIELQQMHGELEHKVEERTDMLRQANRQLIMEIEIRKRTEEKLTRYQQIVSASRDLLAFVDRQYVYRMVNDAYLLYHGRSREEIVGRSVRDVCGAGLFDSMIRANFDQALAGQPTRYEMWVDFAGMGRRYMEVSYEPCRGQGMEVIGVAVNIRDATERLMLEKNLRQSQKLQAAGGLAAGIAHDFNNILHSIYGCAEIASMRVASDETACQALARIRQGCNRAADLVRQVLTFSRRGDLDRQPFDLTALVSEATRLHRVGLPDGIHLDLNLRQCRQVTGDASQIHQVVSNLIVNAVQAMSDSPSGRLSISLVEVDVSAEQAQGNPDLTPGPYARLTVRDTGHGMDQKTMERIFEPFFTTKPIGGGTGLGLAICHGIVTRHGGAIIVDSEHGAGTSFEVYLPVTGGESEGERLASVVAKDSGRICRILYVDDETMNTEVWAMVFEHAGLKVTTAGNGGEAMEIFTRDPDAFDLVITDQRMPGITGLELASRMKELRPKLPVILVTGWNDAAGQAEAEDSPVDRVMNKPIRMDAMLAAIRELLAVAD